MKTIQTINNDYSITEVEPTKVMRSGKLAIHPQVLFGGYLSHSRWSVTHIQTGWAVAESRGESYEEILALAKQLDKLDWNFEQVCQLPQATLNGAHALMDGKWHVLPGVSDAFKKVCFAEPTP